MAEDSDRSGTRPGWRERRALRARWLVLGALVDGHHYGYDLWRATGLRSGRLYVALRVLQDLGAVRRDGDGDGSRVRYDLSPQMQQRVDSAHARR